MHNVRTYLPGQEVNLKVWTRIPHKGWVSVAIVDTNTLLLIFELARFETDSASGYSAHGDEDRDIEERDLIEPDIDFNITIPKLYPRCADPGDCVS